MKEAGQDTKEAYNRTLEKKAKLTKNETSLKGWFCFGHVPLPLTLQRVRLCAASLCFLKKKKKGFTLQSFMLPILNNIVSLIIQTCE
jgi:hypothetical protein